MRSTTSTSVHSPARRVFLDAEYVTVADKDWVISSIRRTMAEQGVLLENNKDKAQVIVEAAFGAYGTDQRDRKFGLPGISLTPSLTTGAAVSYRIFDVAQPSQRPTSKTRWSRHRCSPTRPRPAAWSGRRPRS